MKCREVDAVAGLFFDCLGVSEYGLHVLLELFSSFLVSCDDLECSSRCELFFGFGDHFVADFSAGGLWWVEEDDVESLILNGIIHVAGFHGRVNTVLFHVFSREFCGAFVNVDHGDVCDLCKSDAYCSVPAAEVEEFLAWLYARMLNQHACSEIDFFGGEDAAARGECEFLPAQCGGERVCS